MSLKEKLRRYQDLFIAAGVLAVYAVWACFLPMRCPIVWLTGISCPGCGITRALAAVCRLDFAKAWYYNPMIFYLIPVAPILAIAYFRKAKKLTEVLLWITAGLMIAVYLYRLLVLHSPVLQADPAEGWIAGLFQCFQTGCVQWNAPCFLDPHSKQILAIFCVTRYNKLILSTYF